MVKHSSAGTRGAGTSTFSFPASPPIPPPPTHHTIPHTSTDVKADMRPVQEIEVFQLGVSFKFVYVLQCVFFLHVKEGGCGRDPNRLGRDAVFSARHRLIATKW